MDQQSKQGTDGREAVALEAARDLFAFDEVSSPSHYEKVVWPHGGSTVWEGHKDKCPTDPQGMASYFWYLGAANAFHWHESTLDVPIPEFTLKKKK